jgi:3-isopropylmalate/(R)-2-methylmalate dehydratase large subunit
LTANAAGRTLYAKVWDRHLVRRAPGEPDLLYVDLHLVHEVSSPQAFEGLRLKGRRVRRPDLTLATVDHGVPTLGRAGGIRDPLSRRQVELLAENCRSFAIPLVGLDDPRQGIVHVMAPELGFVQPGMTVVCGDSHTSTHGAFGAVAFGIGTSEVELVLATQTVPVRSRRSMAVTVRGALGPGLVPKDLILNVIARIGVDGAAGHAIEYRGSAITALSMEGRMTVCNMSIEAGGLCGMVAPDDVTFAYLEARPKAPAGRLWEEALDDWRSLVTDETASYDREVSFDAGEFSPYVTWGTNPGQSAPVSGRVPDPAASPTGEREAIEQSLRYMGLKPGTAISDIDVDRVFIGSCTNARIEDLRSAARVVAGKRVNRRVRAMVVPGSMLVKAQAEAEGLDRIFREAGFEWRDAGCSMCIGMNGDMLAPGERCASTSNRNFEGRQGRGGRTHLVSPPMAAAAALAGHFVDVREVQG